MLSHGYIFGAIFIVEKFSYSEHSVKTASNLVFRRVKIFFSPKIRIGLKKPAASNRLRACHLKPEKPTTREPIATTAGPHGVFRRSSAPNAGVQTNPNSYPVPCSVPKTSSSALTALGARYHGRHRAQSLYTAALALENPLSVPLSSPHTGSLRNRNRNPRA